jgi:hypothetical protein
MGTWRHAPQVAAFVAALPLVIAEVANGGARRRSWVFVGGLGCLLAFLPTVMPLPDRAAGLVIMAALVVGVTGLLFGTRATGVVLLVMLLVPHRARAQSSWRVDTTPVVDVAADAPDGTPRFSSITGATRLDDGTLVIADGDDLALRFFDRTGKLVRSVGRSGGGPGEFRSIRWFGRCNGDSLEVWDPAQARMSIFSRHGTFARQFAFRDSIVPTSVLVCAPDGRFLVQGQQRPLPGSERRPSSPGAEWISVTVAAIAIVDHNGRLVRPLGDRSAGLIYAIYGGAVPLPLGGATYLAVAANRMFVGTADAASRIEAYTGRGAPQPVPLRVATRKPTAATHHRAAAVIAAMAPRPMRQMIEDSLDHAPTPEMLPPFAGLFGDRDGVLWVQLTFPGEPGIRLRAIGTRNQVLGEVVLPANVTVQEVDRDAIVASYTDDNDLPHLAVYRLHRGP